MEFIRNMGVKMFGALAAFLTGIIALIVGGRAKAAPPPQLPPGPALPQAPNTTDYNTEIWVPFLQALLPRGIPLVYAKNWITIESNGKPCAIGRPGDKGPDGQPREQGIAQLYNPDDFQAQGIKGNFRAYCVPGGQTCTRPLTSAEMAAQVKGLIGKIRECTAFATKVLAANNATNLPGWSPMGEGFWRLTKMVHGLPGMATGMRFVTAKLKRPPADWAEFKDQIVNKGVKLDSGTEAYRAKYPTVFKNAEETAKGVAGGTVA